MMSCKGQSALKMTHLSPEQCQQRWLQQAAGAYPGRRAPCGRHGAPCHGARASPGLAHSDRLTWQLALDAHLHVPVVPLVAAAQLQDLHSVLDKCQRSALNKRAVLGK